MRRDEGRGGMEGEKTGREMEGKEKKEKENKTELETAFEGQSALGNGITEGMCNWRPAFKNLHVVLKRG